MTILTCVPLIILSSVFNYVEFTQGKLRIARDTTVNDYLCCKGVKGAKFGPIFHTKFVDKWHV